MWLMVSIDDGDGDVSDRSGGFVNGRRDVGDGEWW